MEAELLQSLEDVGYTGPLLDASRFSHALQGGARSPDFTSLISWLTDQIGTFEKLDDTVHPTSSPEDANSFLLELSTFLKELGCANTKLTTGNANQRLATFEDREALIEYLIVELMTSKMLEARKPDTNKTEEITISESITAKNMREMLTALRFQKPPDNISPELLFKKLHAKVTEVIKQVPKDLVGKPIFFGELNNNQWESLDKLHDDLNEEYTIRREMLLKRLDVTINSFAWSERIRPKEDELNKVYHAKRDIMQQNPDVTLAHLLSARDDLAVIEKTSNASVRKNTRSAVNKVIIGAVPDRGGRPCEQEPPPPEMPSWQKDRVQGPQRGGFSGGGGRGGGAERGGGRGGGRGGSGGQGGGGYRDNKSANTNFGQNYDNQPKQFFGEMNLSFGNQMSYQNKSSSYSNQSSGYSSNQNTGYSKGGNYGGNQSSGGYSGQNSSYSGNQSSSGYSSQNSGYSGNNQRSSYGNQGSSGYQNQGSGGYSNQGGGYDRKSGGGDYNRGGQGRGGRVQGGWNQGNDGYNKGSYNDRSGGQGGGRRY